MSAANKRGKARPVWGDVPVGREEEREEEHDPWVPAQAVVKPDELRLPAGVNWDDDAGAIGADHRTGGDLSGTGAVSVAQARIGPDRGT